MYSGFVLNLIQEDMLTAGFSSGVEFLDGDIVTGSSPSANDGIAGSMI